MSAVVTTLIIILLVIVALGIIWVFIKNVLVRGTEQVELAQKCREVDLEVVKLEDTTGDGTSYTITLKRTGAGETIAGVKILLSNTTTNTYSDVLTNFDTDIEPLGTLEETGIDTTGNIVIGANQIDITPYFKDGAGEEELCPSTVTKEF